MTAAVVPLEVRVEQARQAADAGHWRMAELYTARALQLVAIERDKYRQDLGLANRKLRADRMGKGIGSFLEGVVEIVQETFQPVIDGYAELFKSIGPIMASQAQADRDQRLLDVMYATQAGEVLTEDQRRFL